MTPSLDTVCRVGDVTVHISFHRPVKTIFHRPKGSQKGLFERGMRPILHTNQTISYRTTNSGQPRGRRYTLCHTPFPIRPDWRIRTESEARDYILGLSLTCSYIRAELVPVGIQTISVITKIIYIYKRTTTGVVSIKIYTHILSPIYLYKHLYLYMSNTKHQRLRKQCGEHLSLSWPTLLMWDVLSSILVFCFCTYTD